MTNPYLDAPMAKKLSSLAGIYLGLVSSIIVSSGLSTWLPAAAADIGGTDIYPLASTFAGILSIGAMPLFGYLGARNPALKPFIVAGGLAVGAVVCVVRAVAPDMMTIVWASLFWGVVNAGIFVLGFSLVRDMFDAEKAGTYLGVIGTFSSIGVLIGPFLTGVIIDTLNWRVVYHVVWPLMLLAAALILLGVRGRRPESPGRTSDTGFDFLGAILLTLFLTALILCLSFGSGVLPFGSPGNNALIALAALSLIGLVFTLRRKGANAIIPASVLSDRNTVALSGVVTLQSFSHMAVFFFMPSYVLFVLGGTATEAGLTTTLLAVVGIFLGPFLGRLIGKQGTARPVIVAGLIVRIAVTLALLLILGPGTPLWLLYTLMLIAGIYNSQQSVTASTAPQIQLRPEVRVQGNSVVQVGQTLGGAIGLAVFTTIIGVQGPVEGTHTALIVAMVTAVAALAFALFLRRNEPVPAAG